MQGFVYPNEQLLLWSVLIVVYPYITGLVAGAFIMASLARVFHVKALEPAYRLALLTALAFLICAPLPLLLHLGHPERCLEVMMTPHFTSPMAMFGFVYAWYIMAVLLLELWFELPPRLRPVSHPNQAGAAASTAGSRSAVRDLSPARCGSTIGCAISSRWSASRRRSCCTATWDSSSAR